MLASNIFSRIKYSSKAKLLEWIQVSLLLLVVCGGYAMLIIGAYYSYPGAEDYEVSCSSRDIGVISSVIESLTNYDGRYTTNLLHAINPLVFNWIRGYALMNFIGVFSLQLGLYLFMSLCLKTKSRLHGFLYSALVLVVYMGSIPCYATFYQMTGNFVYLYPGAFVLFFLTALAQYFKEKKNTFSSNSYFLMTGSLLVIAIGFLELYLLFYAMLLTGILFYTWQTERTLLKNFLPIYFIGFSSILFFVLAPSVSAHISTFDQVINPVIFFNVFANSIKNYTLALFYILLKPICICSILYGVILFQSKLFALKKVISRKNIFLFMTAIMAVTFLMTLLYYFPKMDDTSNPEKIYTPILFLLLVFVFVFLCSAVPLPSALLRPYVSAGVKVILLVIVLVNFISGDNNLSSLFADYRNGSLQKFKDFMDNRISLLKSASQSDMAYKTVCVPALVDYPKSIYNPLDKETDRNTSKWNKCHEEYFRIDEVTTEGDTTRKFR
ncbi:MAG: DUF6056 family protein [Chitinophagales bacterium]